MYGRRQITFHLANSQAAAAAAAAASVVRYVTIETACIRSICTICSLITFFHLCLFYSIQNKKYINMHVFLRNYENVIF